MEGRWREHDGDSGRILSDGLRCSVVAGRSGPCSNPTDAAEEGHKTWDVWFVKREGKTDADEGLGLRINCCNTTTVIVHPRVPNCRITDVFLDSFDIGSSLVNGVRGVLENQCCEAYNIHYEAALPILNLDDVIELGVLVVHRIVTFLNGNNRD